MSSDFWWGLAACFLVVAAIALTVFVLYVLWVVFEWLNDKASDFSMVRTHAIDPSINDRGAGNGIMDERMEKARAFVEDLAMSPTFRMVRLFGHYFVICKDYSDSKEATHGKPGDSKQKTSENGD